MFHPFVIYHYFIFMGPLCFNTIFEWAAMGIITPDCLPINMREEGAEVDGILAY